MKEDKIIEIQKYINTYAMTQREMIDYIFEQGRQVAISEKDATLSEAKEEKIDDTKRDYFGVDDE